MESAPGALGQRVLWVLISDSMYLRRCVAKKYGGKILTGVGDSVTIKH